MWQKENDNLNQLFKKIKQSKIVISVVGLGCHIAMLFNKKIILLAGPTYFNEIDSYKNARIVKPEKLCKIHSHKLNVKVNSCGCMNEIRNEKILKLLKKIL